MSSSRGALLLLLAGLLVALVLRGMHLAQMTRLEGGEVLFHAPVVDAEEYHVEALRIARGEAWQVPVHGPLFPLLLGGLYALVGEDLVAARWMQLVIGLLAIGLLFPLARAWIGDLPAGLACLSLALYRPALLFQAELYCEGLAVMLLIAALLALQRATREASWSFALVFGFLLGALALTRSNLALLLPLGALALFLLAEAPRARRVRAAGLALLCGALPLVLVARANHAASGEWVGLQAQGGLALWMANHPESEGVPDIRPGPAFDALQREPRRVTGVASPSADSAYWRERVRRSALEDPLAFLGLLARKAWNTLSCVEVPSSYDPEAQRASSTVARLPLPGFETLFPLALAGFAAGAWRARSRRLCLLLALIVLASLVLGFSAGRYRFQLAPLLALGAGTGMVALASRARAAWIAASIGLVLVLLAPRFAEARSRWQAEVDALRSTAWIRLAAGARTTAERQLALKEAWLAFERGVVKNPYDPRLWCASGFLQMHGDDARLGSAGVNYEDALQRTTKALELRPDYVEALRNRAAILGQLGRWDLAARDLERLLQELPWSEGDRTRLAEARWRSGGGR
ncbi:MAG: glycosyltransferase family 39 protein [Planctomycetes bacterium]|nr:glycosyltransferase family 39 protein [Planctomycetota bacterium]